MKWNPALTFPGVAAGETLTRETELPPIGRRSWRATGRRWPRARIASRPAAPPPTSSAASGPSPPRTRRTTARSATRTAPRSARRASSGRSRASSPARRAGGCSPAAACSRRSQPQRRKDVRTTIDLKIEDAATTALGGRLGAVAVIQPADRPGAGAVGHRARRPPAPGLDVQDHHDDRRAGGQEGQAERPVPGRDRRAPLGRAAVERQRRVVRRQLRALLRRVVQLGVRAARGEGRRPSASCRPPRSSA